MKTEFELVGHRYNSRKLDFEEVVNGRIKIYAGKTVRGKFIPAHVIIDGQSIYTEKRIKDKDLERFAVNILKALKSKHLKK